ncbi:MAG: L,D-transpeptidase [Pseudomonadota bacterium]
MRKSPYFHMICGALAFSGIAAFSTTALPGSAQAEIVWRDGSPVFLDRAEEARRKALQRKRAQRRYPSKMTGGARPTITPKAPQSAAIANTEKAGTVIIDTSARKLFYIKSASQVLVYPISVGRIGFQWTGTETVSRVADWPSWHPPAAMRKREPYLPKTMTGGVRNPLGAKAIYLGQSLYRIHGTNKPKSIGHAASSGCFRMMNHHVVHLAGLVDVGTTVKVVKKWDRAVGVAALTNGPANGAAGKDDS